MRRDPSTGTQIAFRNSSSAPTGGFTMLRILFLCTGNSCRSQMAEGWARRLKAGLIEAYSAGVEPHGLHPDAVRVMAEAGVNISGQRSKLVAEVRGVDFDFVVTFSDRARKACPAVWERAHTIHVGLESPPRLATGAQTEEERLAPYRQVRDAIHAIVESLPDSLCQHSIAGRTDAGKRLYAREIMNHDSHPCISCFTHLDTDSPGPKNGSSSDQSKSYRQQQAFSRWQEAETSKP